MDLEVIEKCFESNCCQDDGSLDFLFKDYEDDGIREPLVDFGESIGNEKC